MLIFFKFFSVYFDIIFDWYYIYVIYHRKINWSSCRKLTWKLVFIVIKNWWSSNINLNESFNFFNKINDITAKDLAQQVGFSEVVKLFWWCSIRRRLYLWSGACTWKTIFVNNYYDHDRLEYEKNFNKKFSVLKVTTLIHFVFPFQFIIFNLFHSIDIVFNHFFVFNFQSWT